MSTATLKKSFLKGTITAPSSKSAAHRIMICAALSYSKCYIKNVSWSDDMQATINCLETLGAKYTYENKTLFLDATNFVKEDDKSHFTLNCKESGTTLRIFIPLCAALGLNVTFIGEGRLPQRPIDEYLTIFDNHGVEYEKGETYLPLKIKGKLCGDFFEISPKISSQYVTGLIFALSLLKNDVTLKLTSKTAGSQYVDLTLDVIKKFSVDVIKTKDSYLLKGDSYFKAQSSYSDKNAGISVEGDWSQAAFFLCAGAINGDVTVCGLDVNSAQGDKAIVDILKTLGADISVQKDSVHVKKSALKGADINALDTPDLVPVVALTCSLACGNTNIFGVQRLKFKESDRLLSTAQMITSLGGKVTYTDDCMTVFGNSEFCGGTIDSFNDHRIVMSSAIGALLCEDEVIIEGANAVNKSYSDFFEDYKSLGGIVDVRLRK